jgi:hypothetical protein
MWQLDSFSDLHRKITPKNPEMFIQKLFACKTLNPVGSERLNGKKSVGIVILVCRKNPGSTTTSTHVFKKAYSCAFVLFGGLSFRLILSSRMVHMPSQHTGCGGYAACVRL